VFDVVRYLDSRDVPPAREMGYDYILAGNGVFKRARCRHVEVCLPVATMDDGRRSMIAGLPDVEGYVRLRGERLPGWLLAAALEDARRRARVVRKEVMYHLVRREDGRARLVRPRQEVSGAGVAYEGGGDPAILMDLHSHHDMGAFFSSTDDGDALGFRFYGVMGRIFSGRPELALRVGVWGDCWSVPVLSVFTDRGPFVEVAGARREKPQWRR